MSAAKAARPLRVGTDALRRALDCVHHLNDDAPPWQDLLERTSTLLGTDGAVLIVHRQGVVDVRQTGASERAVQDYSTHFHPQDLLLRGMGLPTGTWLDTQSLLSSSERQRSSYYTDFMCKHRMRQLGAVMLAGRSSSQWASLGFQREQPDDRLIERLNRPAITRFLGALQPALLARQQRIEQGMRSTQPVFVHFNEAVLLVNDAGFVIDADEAALQRLALDAGLLLRQRRLWHAQERVRTTIGQALRHAGEHPYSLRLRLQTAEGTRPVELAFALAPAHLRLIGERLLLLKVRFAAARARPQAQHLQERFAITAAEARVLAALADGQTLAEHAQAHGSSIHTVRKQVAVLMAKLGCTRQADLVRKALQAMG